MSQPPRSEREREIIAGDEDLRIAFSREVDGLLSEIVRIGELLRIDPDDLIQVIYRRRLGEYDELLADLIEQDQE